MNPIHPENKEGIKEGDKVKSLINEGGLCSVGDILVLSFDDGTACPRFRNTVNGLEVWMYYSEVTALTHDDAVKTAEAAVEEAQRNLAEAKAKLVEEERKAKEARKIKPEDIKGGALFKGFGGHPRLVVGDHVAGYAIVSPSRGTFGTADNLGFRSKADVAHYMNENGYKKTTDTLKDFL